MKKLVLAAVLAAVSVASVAEAKPCVDRGFPENIMCSSSWNWASDLFGGK